MESLLWVLTTGIIQQQNNNETKIIMEITNYNIEELENKELINIEGGFLQFVLAGIAIAGALYGAGHAVGEAYYHYTHSK